MKVVGIGLNRTGTTTLGACLAQFGYRHASLSRGAFECWKRGDLLGVRNHMEGFDSFEDWPWPLAYRQIDEWFPGSKFILTLRSSPEKWFESLCRHAERIGPTDYRLQTYGFAMPHGHRAEHLRYYQQHIDAVRTYFSTRTADLLEVCWENGDEWEKLADFLSVAKPEVPFPHLNRTVWIWRAWLGRLLHGSRVTPRGS